MLLWNAQLRVTCPYGESTAEGRNRCFDEKVVNHKSIRATGVMNVYQVTLQIWRQTDIIYLYVEGLIVFLLMSFSPSSLFVAHTRSHIHIWEEAALEISIYSSIHSYSLTPNPLVQLNCNSFLNLTTIFRQKTTTFFYPFQEKPSECDYCEHNLPLFEGGNASKSFLLR